jgi:type VI secretion system protein ImpH
LKVPDASFQFFSGALSGRRRPARSLEQALRFLFSWPVDIDPFVGRWLHLDAGEQTRLGSPRTGAIGVSAVVGSKVWDVQSMFRVQNGPLTYPQFESLLPVGSAYHVLTEFTRLYVGAEFDFSLGLLLRSEEIPKCRVGKATGMGSRLGWNTWLCSRPVETPVVFVEIQVRTT